MPSIVHDIMNWIQRYRERRRVRREVMAWFNVGRKTDAASNLRVGLGRGDETMIKAFRALHRTDVMLAFRAGIEEGRTATAALIVAYEKHSREPGDT